MDKKTYLIKQLHYVMINAEALTLNDIEIFAEGILNNLENLEIYCPEENKKNIKKE